jgi:uncharacterized protein (TIGR03435 family)
MRCSIAAWLVLASATGAAAQQSGTPLDFEVASVKRAEVSGGAPVGAATGVVAPGGRWSATNVTVSQLIQNLYGLRPEQIVGAPSWVNSDMFVIRAQAGSPSATQAQLSEMAKRLLRERFGLRFHVEQQSFKVHALHLARRDGSLGPGLQATRCAPRPAAGAASAPLASPEERRPCGSFTRRVVDGLSKFQHNGMSLRTLLLAHQVEALLGTRVIDETGRIDDSFDVNLEYVPDQVVSSQPAGAPLGPTLINAFEEQLGLKFERRDQILERFVIDSVSAPSPD